mgnify:FL=1
MSNNNNLKFEFNSKNKLIIIFSTLISIGILLRIIFLDFDIPIFVDATDYYTFAYKIVTEGGIPKHVLETNDGWSWFLSFFFMFFKETDFVTLSALQKILSVIISALTFIPVFYLCRNFVSEKFAVIGGSLFIFDPRIILNSTLGITEPLFILLNSIVLAIIFTKNQKNYIFAFILIGILSIVRYEGLLMIIPISIIYFLKFKKSKNVIRNFCVYFVIFCLIILSVGTVREDTSGINGFTSHLFTGIEDYFSSSTNNISNNSNDTQYIQNNFWNSFFVNLISNTLKYLGWISLPLLIIFIPFGIFRIFKNENKDGPLLIIIFSFMIIPALYAFGRDFLDPRYLFQIIPIFCVISVFGFSKIRGFSERFWIPILLIIVSILVLSLIAIDDDNTIRFEKYLLAKILVDSATGVNSFDGQSFIKIAELEKEWPKSLPVDPELGVISITKKFSYDEFHSVEDFIFDTRDIGLSHLVIYESNNTKFLDDVYQKPDSSPYLELEFDSKTRDFESKVRIYKINYEEFDKMN